MYVSASTLVPDHVTQVVIELGQPAVATSIGHMFKANQAASVIRDYIIDGGLTLRGIQ